MAKPMTKQEIRDSLGRPKWNLGIVSLAFAAKKISREEKGEVFDCFVLNNDENELKTFLTKLKNNISAFEDGYHFQVAVRVKDSLHWCGIDFKIIKGPNGLPRLHAFCIDAAGDSSGTANLNIVREVFPDSLCYYHKADSYEIVDENGKTLEKKMNIQFSPTGCIRFTRDHLARLSQTDYFAELEEMTSNNTLSKDRWGDIPVATSKLPDSLSFLFRTVQSTKVLERLSEDKRDFIVSNKGLTLVEYVEGKSEIDQSGKKLLKAIDYKKASYEESVIELLGTISEAECQEIQLEANGFKFIDTYSESSQNARKARISKEELPIQSLIKAIGIKIVEISNENKSASRSTFLMFNRASHANSIRTLMACAQELKKFDTTKTALGIDMNVDMQQASNMVKDYAAKLKEPVSTWLKNQAMKYLDKIRYDLPSENLMESHSHKKNS